MSNRMPVSSFPAVIRLAPPIQRWLVISTRLTGLDLQASNSTHRSTVTSTVPKLRYIFALPCPSCFTGLTSVGRFSMSSLSERRWASDQVQKFCSYFGLGLNPLWEGSTGLCHSQIRPWICASLVEVMKWRMGHTFRWILVDKGQSLFSDVLFLENFLHTEDRRSRRMITFGVSWQW